MELQEPHPGLAERLEACLESIRPLGRVLVGLSGGVDSAVLAALAARALGAENVVAATVTGLYHAARETQSARDMARRLGVELVEFDIMQLDEDRVLDNPPDRCYWCKRLIFTHLGELAKQRGIAALLSGSNADDRRDYRPGAKAESELQVRRPMLEAGLGKDDIRQIARNLDLPVWSKPSAPCLATRVPYGRRLTPELLARIEAGENVLRDAGFANVRLRDHEDTARIEIPPDDFAALIARRQEIVARLREIGYRYVAMDLDGFRSGSMNDMLDAETLRQHREA